MENYYDILGVSPDASDEEIKKAHRQQYIKWHPDRASPSEKLTYQNRCKKINAAYSVLSDPQKRREYNLEIGIEKQDIFTDFSHGFEFGQDPFANFFSNYFGSKQQKRQTKIKTLDVSVVVTLNIKELYYGNITKQITYTRLINCFDCGGIGLLKTNAVCRICGGRGFTTPNIFGIVRAKTICSKCEGTGRELKTCTKCKGETCIHSETKKQITLNYSIPNNTTLTYDGGGHLVGKMKGKLNIKFVYDITPYELLMDKLCIKVDVPFTTVFKRELIKIPFLNETFSLQIPDIYFSDQIFTIKNAGFLNPSGYRELLYIKLRYKLPSTKEDVTK